MKTVSEPGAVLLFEGKLARVIAIGEGKTLTLEFIDEGVCPTCGSGRFVHVLEHSPLFQHNAKSVATIEGA